MAATSIIEIELRDEAFKKFNALFDEYNEKLKAMPSTWQKVDKVLQSNAGTFKKLSVLAKVTSEEVKKAETGQKKLASAAQGTARAFQVLAKSSSQIAKNILSATGSLLKWASLAGVASGLLGIGGLFGLRGLAERASETQITARGAGVSPGQLKAGQIAFGQMLGGPSGVTATMEKINQMVMNETLRAPLAALGFTDFEKMKKMSSLDLLNQIIPKLRQQMKSFGGSTAMAEAAGFTKIFDPVTITAITKYSDEEVDNLIKLNEQLSSQLEVGNKTLGQWANLNRTLDASEQKIENVFIKALVGLTPQIERLSNAFAEAVKAILQSPLVKEGLDKISKGLGHLADYLGSDKFRQDIDNLEDAIATVGRSLYGLAKLLGKMLPEEEPTFIKQLDKKTFDKVSGLIKKPSPERSPLETMEHISAQSETKQPIMSKTEIAQARRDMAAAIQISFVGIPGTHNVEIANAASR